MYETALRTGAHAVDSGRGPGLADIRRHDGRRVGTLRHPL